ncbi:MAG: two-component system sensor histidine kinase NtrB, partial [Bacillota bacterium]
LGEIDRVDGIISNFLNLAKPKKINKEILTVNEIIREVMFLVENEALRKEITPDIVLEDNLPFIEGDKHQLIQVFLNIINNAFQATPVGRKFAIKSKVSSDGTKLIVDFIDSGEGISPENLSKIFDPFFSTKDDGTGLGLAISNRIINDHEGEIKVFSKPGEGSIFSVILPVKR